MTYVCIKRSTAPGRSSRGLRLSRLRLLNSSILRVRQSEGRPIGGRGTLKSVISDNAAQAMVQTAISAGIPTLAVLVGILVNNSRLSDLRAHMDDRLNDLRAYVDTRFADIDRHLADVDSRMADLRTIMDRRLANVDSRMTDLRTHMDTRFEDLKAMWRSELHRVEEVMDARLKHLEERE